MKKGMKRRFMALFMVLFVVSFMVYFLTFMVNKRKEFFNYLTPPVDASVKQSGIPIFCPKCHTLLYYYQRDIVPGVPILPEYALPASPEIPQPRDTDAMVCPLDKAPLNGWEFIFWEKGLPKPTFVYPAESVLTKDENGNYRWIPYDVDVKL